MARRIEYDVPATATDADGGEVALAAHLALGPYDRLMGLMGQDEVPEWRCVIFPRCTSIHTFWMHIPIDVLWLGWPEPDGTARVMGCVHSMPRSRVELAPEGSWGVLEAAAHTFDQVPETVRVDGMDTRGRVRG